VRVFDGTLGGMLPSEVAARQRDNPGERPGQPDYEALAEWIRAQLPEGRLSIILGVAPQLGASTENGGFTDMRFPFLQQMPRLPVRHFGGNPADIEPHAAAAAAELAGPLGQPPEGRAADRGAGGAPGEKAD
jgi:hypothetical protein